MPATIIIPQSIGQIGNRLEQFSHLIALHEETGARIVNPSFSLYSEFFEGTYDDPLCRYPGVHSHSSAKGLQRLFYVILRSSMQARLLSIVPHSVWVDIHWTAGAYDLGNPQFRQFIREKKWIFLSGHWKHRHWSNYEAGIQATRDHFRLVPGLRTQVDRHMGPIKAQCEILVGLHVRQGDNFTDPVRRDAFTSEEHAQLARKIAALFPGRKVTFLICTNKPQPRALYEGLTVFDGPGDFILDMYSLSECDYIAGAGQSSFSGWASLMGQKPRYRFFDPHATVTLDDFQVCRGVED